MLRSGFSRLAAANGVEGRDLRSSGLRTPSGPEGSSGKEKLEGAAVIRAGVVNRGASWGPLIEAGVRGHPKIKSFTSNLSPFGERA